MDATTNSKTIRNLKLFTALLLVALAVSIYFNLMNTPSNQRTDPDESICSDFSDYKPSTLPTGLVSDLTKNYRLNQLVEINKVMPTTDPDAHSIWFDLDTIKKFIYHIEKNVKANSVNDEKLGLRMYYAAYPDSTQFNKPGNEDLKDLDATTLTRKYGLKHTIVMIPTIFNNAVGDVDFNPLDKNTYTGYISTVKKIEVQGDVILKADYLNAGYNPMALAPTSRVVSRNHGSLIPPGIKTVEAF